MDLLDLVESFEKEIRTNVKSINLDRKIDWDVFSVNNAGISVTYKDPGTQLLWRMYFSGFNKAKKLIKSSLPAVKHSPENFYDAGFNECINECRKRINAQQIKTI